MVDAGLEMLGSPSELELLLGALLRDRFVSVSSSFLVVDSDVKLPFPRSSPLQSRFNLGPLDRCFFR